MKTFDYLYLILVIVCMLVFFVSSIWISEKTAKEALISKESLTKVYELEKQSKCWGDMSIHCDEYYDFIIETINK